MKKITSFINNKLVLLMIFFIITIILITIVSLFIKQNFKNPQKKIINQNNNYLKNNQIINTLTPTVTKNVISNMFFSYKIESLNERRKILTIYLKGTEDSLADVADLKLEYNNVVIEKIIEGDSFIFYPRKIINNNSIIITGVSLDEKNNLKYAKPNTIFVKIIIKINPTPPNLITLNTQETKIYYNAQDITDTNNLFKKINLK